MNEPLRVADELLRNLRQASVSFAHWKSNGHLDQALAGATDIDLLVRSGDEGRLQGVMAAMTACPMLSQPWARYPDIEDWLLFDRATGRLLHLHVHYKMLTGLKRIKHLHLPWEEHLLRNLRLDPGSGWPIPTAEMELLVLFVRIWAKMPPWQRLLGPRLPAHIFDEFCWLRQDVSVERLRALAGTLGLTADDEVWRGLVEGAKPDPSAIIAEARRLYGLVRHNYRMPWVEAIGRAALLTLFMVVSRQWRRLGGFARTGKTAVLGGALIALIGSDGAGKSTLSRDIGRWLRFKLDVQQIYMGSGDGRAGWVNGLRRKISALWKRRERNGRARVAATLDQGNVPAFAPARVYRLLDLRLMRRKLRHLRRGRRMAERGSVILCDRYPQNQVNAISDGPRLQDGRGFAWAARMELRLYDEAVRLGPDLLIKLHVDPAVALRRKPDHDLDVLTLKSKIVAGLTFPHSQQVTIDTDRPYDEVLLEAKQAIWTFITTRKPKSCPR